ncbi:hypothetical protein [Pontibacillus salipaludis]|uniref:Lipoprotein n=1 Tax=Pontibacillus salipaludis TaxID=1697394 RepID=A0ABQ1QFW2_9BACI|nr:hypothetical protein [Pontibacillus salipaludis]GGD25707.1 hypothetical protein GCM10011389_36620 [Pontibacillus salipaludis]
MKKLMISLALLAFLVACSNGEQVIEIEGKDRASALFIQKVENHSTSDESSLKVNDRQLIEKVLTKVEGLTVKETTTEKTMEKMKSSITYMFVFSESEEFQTGKPLPYAFYILEDGTFIFPYSDFNSKQNPLITTDNDQELLDEMKDLVEIEF